MSSFAIILFSPLFLLIILILKFTGEGEIFFIQTRVGYNQTTFPIIKFATMLKNSPNIYSGTITIKDDPRILPIGKFLRKSKINELPQLFNVFLGHMSLIGPRPLSKDDFDFYTEDTKKIISTVKPGLSGLGSIFFSNEESHITNFEEAKMIYEKNISKKKAMLEIWYVKNKSLFLYFLLIFLTVLVLINKKTIRVLRIFYNNLPY